MADRFDSSPATRVHGGLDRAALEAQQIDPDSLVDFSVNLNPYGPNEAVLTAVRDAPLDRYPDPGARAARLAWARELDRRPEEIAVGHGAADLFWAIARAALERNDQAVIAEPTFSEFRIAAAACGARISQVRASPESGFRLDLEALARAAREATALYLCSPNNPTGEYLEPTRIRALATALPRTLIVLDQSFLGLSNHAAQTRERWPDNVLCVRSLTKEFACPGLRIGLCFGAASWIERIEAMRPTWATSSQALAALLQTASEANFVQRSWSRMRDDRDATTAMLAARGLAALPSATCYQLVAVPVYTDVGPLAEARATRFCRRMLAQGVWLRDCSSFGLPGHVRIAALPQAARERLSAALDAVLSTR